MMKKTYEFEFFDKRDSFGMPVVTVRAGNVRTAWEKLRSEVTGSPAYPKRPTVKQLRRQLFLGGKTSAPTRLRA